MPSPRLAAAIACAAALALPATAAAAPPPNDNYLASTIVSNSAAGTLPNEFSDAVDTTEATTQADLFNPQQDGAPGSGGGAEPLACGTTPFAKTVWYDLHPPTWGGVQLNVSGFDVAVAVYQWSSADNRITKQVLCQNDDASTAEEVLFNVRKGTNYTVQVGGVNGAGGPLTFKALYFRDSDNDQTLDAEPDECPGIRGSRGDGCPPTATGVPRYTTLGSTLTSLMVQNVQKGSKVEVSCSRCGSKFVKKARKRGTVKVRKFGGRTLRAGDHLVIRVTHGASGSGKFKFGAFGRYYSYAVTGDGLGRRTDRCTNPGKRKPVKCRD